jgi:DNA primase
MIAEPNGFADRFRQRIMIPIHDARGRVVGFGGRAVRPEQEPKYRQLAGRAAFDKGRTLYNLHRAAAPAARRGGW